MKKIIIFIIFIFLVGCQNNLYLKEESLAVNLPKDSKVRDVYNLYVEKEYNLKKYEPEEKIYKGVYLEQEEGDFIKEFEKLTNTSQSIYLKNIKLGESFPLSWVLSCYSNTKTPFITINSPDDIEKIYDENIIKEMAKDFGHLQIPIFLNMYPLSDDFIKTKDEYIEFLQIAKNYFELYAPNVSFIWSVEQKFVYQAKEFYPGDNYAEWVGINIDENIDENNNLNIMFKELDFFYKNFSAKKPIFINLAISHFGSESYNYKIEEKIKELNRYYTNIPYKYPRIKMINYINYDTFNTKKLNKQNYLITDNKKILDTYTNATNQPIFTDSVIFANNGRKVLQKAKSKNLVYKIGEDFFIEADKVEETEGLNKVNINNKNYYNIEEILIKHSLEKYIDMDNKNLLIHNKEKN